MMIKKCQAIFLTKTRDEWAEIFRGSDACFAPVLNAEERKVILEKDGTYARANEMRIAFAYVCSTY